MTAIITLLLALFVSLLITRIATIALAATGLSRESARFQARSAFTGAGFTTSESEQVVRHPVRRRIVMMLMLVGNAGIVAVVASFVLAFVDPGRFAFLRVVVLVGGIVSLWLFATSPWLDRHITRATMWALRRWTTVDARDYASLLHLGGDYVVTELRVPDEHWLAGRSLSEAKLREEGVMVLGITNPDGTYDGVPRRSRVVRPGDVLVLYSRTGRLAELDARISGSPGEVAHQEAVAAQRREDRHVD
jgi:hypothetical protein